MTSRFHNSIINNTLGKNAWNLPQLSAKNFFFLNDDYPKNSCVKQDM